MNARERSRRDLLTLGLAVLLLAAVVGGFWLSSSRAKEKRRAVLAGVPQFPARGQAPSRPSGAPARPAPPLAKAAPPPAPDAGTPPRAAPPVDRLTSFVLAPASTVTVVQLNALLNTPLYERLRQCLPGEFAHLQATAQRFGLDFERDLDRVAMVPGGMAMSGWFEGKPLAEQLARSRGAEPGQRDYRGVTQWVSGPACYVQMGNLLLAGPAPGCDKLVDRALDPPPAGDAAQELYGDVYMRSDLSMIQRGGEAPGLTPEENDLLGGLLDSLSGVTVRANVWDQVALTLEGAPKDPQAVGKLARMARGAVSVAKDQLTDDDVGLQTLADLAKVGTEGGNLKVDLALPADDLFDKLHLPCPGRADGGTR